MDIVLSVFVPLHGYIMYDISNCRVKKNKSANMAKRNSG